MQLEISERVSSNLLGSSCKKDPDRALTLAKTFAAQIRDWAVCDTLGMQGVKEIAIEKQIELFAWSNKLVKSRNLWECRLSLVLLTHFVKDKSSRTQMLQKIYGTEMTFAAAFYLAMFMLFLPTRPSALRTE